MWTAEEIGAGANVITAIATCGAAGVAAVGLHTWKRELKGRAEFDTARSLARCVYALREALSAYRVPFYSKHEFLNGDMESADGFAHMFQNRWAPVNDALVAFGSAVLEAEALWGSDARERTNRLEACVTRVFVATEAFIANKRSAGRDFEAAPDFGRQIRADVAGALSNDQNELSQEIKAAIVAIEAMLKPHLTRK